MAILLRSQGGKWQKVAEIDFKTEAELQQLLSDSPELLDTDDEGNAIEFDREAGLPGSGFTELVCVDCHGNVLIVESKLARNREIRRTVIGQVMEYAAFLCACHLMSSTAFLSLARASRSLT